jgi:putative phosphoribosyl transferase
MFADRHDAGRELAKLLQEYAAAPDAVVLGIPRGGVVVAAEVARDLDLPLGVVVTAKVGSPDNPEYALGALAPDGVIVSDPRVSVSAATLDSLAGPAREKIARSLALFAPAQPPSSAAALPPAAPSTAIVVDDGLATGLTALAAVRYLRRSGTRHIVLAVPVAAADSARALEREVDRLVVADTPPFFSAVGQFYVRFGQTSDSEVTALLREAADRSG